MGTFPVTHDQTVFILYLKGNTEMWGFGRGILCLRLDLDKGQNKEGTFHTTCLNDMRYR